MQWSIAILVNDMAIPGLFLTRRASVHSSEEVLQVFRDLPRPSRGDAVHATENLRDLESLKFLEDLAGLFAPIF
jgi:hypothetical protein